MAKLNNVEIHYKHSNRTYNTMTAFLVMSMHDACMCSATGAPAVGIFPLSCTLMRISWIDVNDATRTEPFGSSQYSVEVDRSATDGLNDSLDEIVNRLLRMRCTGSLDNNNNNGNVHVLTILSALHK